MLELKIRFMYLPKQFICVPEVLAFVAESLNGPELRRITALHTLQQNLCSAFCLCPRFVPPVSTTRTYLLNSRTIGAGY